MNIRLLLLSVRRTVGLNHRLGYPASGLPALAVRLVQAFQMRRYRRIPCSCCAPLSRWLKLWAAAAAAVVPVALAPGGGVATADWGGQGHGGGPARPPPRAAQEVRGRKGARPQARGDFGGGHCVPPLLL